MLAANNKLHTLWLTLINHNQQSLSTGAAQPDPGSPLSSPATNSNSNNSDNADDDEGDEHDPAYNTKGSAVVFHMYDIKINHKAFSAALERCSLHSYKVYESAPAGTFFNALYMCMVS